MTALYNEIDPYCAEWLRNLIKEGLIPDGIVDERDIRLLQPADLEGFVQVHLFAGLGGWPYAARLAGWPDDRPLWTGSCPCQPFSQAGRGRSKGVEDARHLWPEFYRLICAVRPAFLVGEQVAAATVWLDGVWADLEDAGYAFRPIVLPACSVDAPHKRERIWFMAHADGEGQPDVPVDGEVAGSDSVDSVAYADCQPSFWASEPREECGFRRVKSGLRLLAPRLPGDVDRLRALGNAIVPQVGAEILRAVMEMDG